MTTPAPLDTSGPPGHPADDLARGPTPATAVVAPGLLLGRGAFVAALRQALLAMATDTQTRQLLWRDTHFGHWPLDEPAVLDSLAIWLRLPGRSITLLAADFEALARQHPRFAQWRRWRVHAVHARQPEEPHAHDLASLLLAPRHALLLQDCEHWRARVVTQTAELAALEQQCDALLQRCGPGWPATTLGL